MSASKQAGEYKVYKVGDALRRPIWPADYANFTCYFQLNGNGNLLPGTSVKKPGMPA